MKHETKKNPRGAVFADVASEVCRFYGLGQDRVLTKRRDRELVDARQLIAYLCRRYVGMKHEAIASLLSGNHAAFDHSTIVHAVSAVDDRLQTDPRFTKEVEAIKARLGFPSTPN